MRKFVIAIVVLGIALALACRLLLPDGLVVKGPVLNSITGRSIEAPKPEVVEHRFSVAPGFRVELFAEGVQNARLLRFSPGGSLVVSQPRLGRLLQLSGDGDGDGRSDGRRVLLDGLDRPHGFDFADEFLFVAEGGAIARVAVQEAGPDTLRTSGAPIRVVDGIPEGQNHWTRTLRIGPDGLIYLTVGSSCNVCIEKDPRRAAMIRYAIDGSGEEIYASGLRNSVGFDWRPGTRELYATDNGRDLLGDDVPPCELNRIERGGFYGWPYAHGMNQVDPDFGEGQPARIAGSIPPVHGFGAHQAPLGITFLRHFEFASEPARDVALVALHGSWNRSQLSGYKVVALHWDADGSIRESDFLTGFQVGDDVIGRPVDVTEGPDGAIYVSDDYAAAVYRITRSDTTQAPTSLVVGGPTPRAVSDPLAEYTGTARAELVARGAELFAARACAGCHVEGLAEPGVVVKPIENLAARYTLQSLAGFLLTPQPPMPVVDLPEADRLALAAHLFDRFDREPAPDERIEAPAAR